MRTKLFRRPSLPIFGITLLFLLNTGCQLSKGLIPEKSMPLPNIKKVVVIGFRPVLSSGDESGVIRNPISGAVFMAEPVPRNIVRKMTDSLFKKLLDDKGYELVSPGKAKGVFSSLVSSDVVLGDREVIQRIGQAFSADALLIGYMYRWREREGTDYAANRPASVAFDLYLVSAGHGGVLWKGRFDKSQRSLSENLFDMDTFVRGGGKWMTAESLAELGLEVLFEEMPKGQKKAEE